MCSQMMTTAPLCVTTTCGCVSPSNATRVLSPIEHEACQLCEPTSYRLTQIVLADMLLVACAHATVTFPSPSETTWGAMTYPRGSLSCNGASQLLVEV